MPHDYLMDYNTQFKLFKQYKLNAIEYELEDAYYNPCYQTFKKVHENGRKEIKDIQSDRDSGSSQWV